MRFCTLLSIVVCCTIKVHTAPLQKRDVETNSEKGNSEIDNLKQQASSTFSNLPGKNNNANKPNNIGQWVKGVPSKWPVKTKANNGGKPNGKQTSNKKLKEKTNQLDEDEMTGNMFEEPETEGDTVAKVEQDGSEMPREESVDNNQENNANNKKNNSTKKKKKNTRKNYPTMVQNPLYIGGLLGFPHENMDNEGITTHTEVWKWNDGEEVVLINDVNPKSSNQKSNSDNVFLREKRNFDEKNIPFVAEFVPKDYQHANLYSETQTPKKNIEENENYGSTKSLTGNDDYEKDNAQLRNELDDDSVTISPEEQDSLIPQSELKESPKDLQLKESFFEFNKEHINNELTKIESKTTPFSTLSNNHDDDVYRNNIKKKIIKRLVPKINLTKPNEKINAIENDDESLQHNFNNDESINSKDSIPTEHSTNDNIQTNKMRNIESNRNPGPDQLLQSDKIRNGLGNRQFFDKKDRTTANLDEKEKSDELPSSSTKNEISDKLQNTNKDNLDEDELKNNNLFSSDDFFLDGSILDTDDKNNVNVSYLNETLDNPDDKNKMNDVSLKPNDNSRLELSSFESNEVNKIPQTDTAYTDNYEKNHNLNITPQNDDNTNYVQYLDETPNIPVEDPKLESLSLNQPKIPLHNLQSHVSNDKNKNMIILNKDKLNNNDYISYKNDLNKPNENNLTNGLTFNENPISNIESSNQVSKEENQKNPQYGSKTNNDASNNPSKDMKPTENNVLPSNSWIDNDNFFDKADKTDLEMKDRAPFIEETSAIPIENDISHGLSKNPKHDDQTNLSELNNNQDDIKPNIHDVLLLDQLFINDNKLKLEDNDKDTPQLKDETFNKPDENVVPNGMLIYGEPNPNFHSPNNVYEQGNGEYPQPDDYKSKKTNNSYPDNIAPIKNDILSLNNILGDNLVSDNDKSNQQINDEDTAQLNEKTSNSSDENVIPNGLAFKDQPNRNIQLSNQQEISTYPQYGNNTNNDVSNDPLDDMKPKENPWKSWFGYGNLFSAKDDSKMGVNDKLESPLLKQPLDSSNKEGILNGLPIIEKPDPIQTNKVIINNNPVDIEPMENDVFSFNDILSDDNLFGEDDKQDMETNDKDAIKLKEETLDKPDRNDNLNDLPFNKRPIPNIESPNHVYDNDNTADSQPDNHASKNPINSYPDDIEPMENDVLSFNDILSDDNLFGEDDKSDVEINDKDAIKLKEDTLDKPDRNDNINDLPFNEGPILNIESPNYVNNNDNTADSQPDSYASKNPINSYPDGIEPMENDVLSFNDILSDDNLFGEDDKSDVEINEKNAIKLNEDTLDKPDRNDNINDLPFNEGPILNIESPNYVNNNDNTADSQPDSYASKNPINSYPDGIEPMENDVLSFNDILSNDNLFREDDKSNLQINDEDTAQLNEKTSNSSDENVIPNGLAFNEQLNQNNESFNYVSNEDNKKNPQYGSNKNNDVSNDPLGDMKPKENPWKSWFGYGNLFSAKDDSKMGVNDKLESPLLKQPLDSSNKEGILNGLPIIEKPDPIQTNKVIINNNPGDIEPMENDVFSFNDILSDDNLFGEDDKQDMETNDKDAIKLKEETLDKSDRNDNINDLPFNKRPIPNIESPNHVYDNDNTADSQPDNHASKNPINSYPDDIEPMENDVLSFNDILSDDNLFGEDDKSDVEINEKNAIKLNEDTLDKPDRNDNLNDLPFNEGPILNIESPNYVNNNDNTADSQPDSYASKNPINSYPDGIEPMENDVLSFNDILSDDNLFGEDDKSNLQINDEDTAQLNEKTSNSSDENDEQLNQNNESSNYVSNEDSKKNPQYGINKNNDVSNDPLDDIKPKENPWKSWFGYGNLFSSKNDSKMGVNDKLESPLLKQPLDSSNKEGILNGLPIIEKPNPIQTNKVIINNNPDDIEPMENDVLSFNDILSDDNLFGEDNKSDVVINDKDAIKLKEDTLDKPDRNDNINDLPLNEGPIPNIEPPNHVYYNDNTADSQPDNYASKNPINSYPDDIEPMENDVLSFNDILNIRPNIQPHIIKKKPKIDQPIDGTENNGFNLNLNSDNIGDINNQLNAKNSTKLYKPDSNINIISDIKKPDPNHINYSNKGFYSAEIVEKPKKKGATKNNNSLDLHSTQDVSEFKKKPKSRQKPTKFYDSSPEDDVSSLQVKKNKKTASGTYENPNYTIVLPNTPPVINISPEATPVPSNLDSIFNSSILDKYDLYPKDFWKFMLQNPNIYNQSKNSHLNQNSNELPTHKLKNPIGDGNKNNPNINTVDIFDGTNPELHNIKKSDGTFRPFTPNRYNNDLPAQRKSNKGKTNYFNINTYLSQPTPTDKNSVNSIPPVDSSTNLLDKSQDSIQNYGSKNNKANSNAADDDSKTMKNMNQNC
ncbi:putative uncharacterized protein DDB_G0282133 [Adelges cooleyi]|uniref:putative uncharacterized protein DDB_G0282133 n=1 Tax=Adelges cooleyi TaxID=133065 RepID=UPI0021805CE9|nr:putative uncharacterized protein DDB_G0282133 [Adelges cooleyi]